MALFHHEERAEGEGVDACAVEAADGAAGVGDQRLAEQIEGSVDENGRGRGLAEFVEEAPEAGVGIFLDGVDADFAAIEGKLLETSDGIL